MKWPKLVPDAVCRTTITIRLEEEGVNEDGSPKTGGVIKTMCNLQQKSRWSMNEERRLIELRATALFNGDIAPELETLAGTVEIEGGASWVIHAAGRSRNPDGTVNYTCLELI